MNEQKQDSLISKHNETNSWVWPTIKWALVFWLVVAGFISYVQAQGNYTVNYTVAQNGDRLISLRSNVNYHAYCHILDSRGFLVSEFYLNPYATSRWYYEPRGQWQWRCE